MTRYVVALLCAAPSLFACGTEESAEEQDLEAVETSALPLNVSTDPGWGEVLAKSNGIPVCYIQPYDNLANEKSNIRSAIEGTWKQVSLLRFTGWGTCANSSSGIRIELSTIPDQLGESRVGTNAVVSGRTMRLPTAWAYGGYCGAPYGRTEWCMRAAAVHEFGHALGYEHEQARSDNPSWCTEPKYGTSGTFFGAWDVDSIMNYCTWNGQQGQPTGGIYNPSRPLLSATDKAGTAHFYGSVAEAKSSSVFDASVYLDVYSDLRAAFGTNQAAAESHWVEWGPVEGRISSLTFQVQYYVPKYSDVSSAVGLNVGRAIAHYVRTGLPEGRSGSPVFDPKYYLARYADLRNAFGAQGYAAALNHFRTTGIYEGRRGSAEFDSTYYLANNADVRNTYGANNHRAAALHYMAIGRNAGRLGAYSGSP